MTDKDNFEDPFEEPELEDPFIDDHFSNVKGSGKTGVKENLPDATAVLVLGIISIVGSFCYLVPGIVCGIIALAMSRKAMRMYNADTEKWTPSSHGNLKAGIICSVIGLSLSFLIFMVIIIAILANLRF